VTKASKPARRRSRWRRFGLVLLVVVVVLGVVRLFLPGMVRWYVNRVLDRAEVYRGEIGDVSLHLWRGAYTIHDIRLNKTTGNVPVPFFAAKRMHLAIEWPALLHGKRVGRVSMDGAEMNFVDARDKASAQTGAGGPWLEMLRELFPFEINSVKVRNSTITFRAFHTNPPVDVHLSQVEGEITDLTNVHDDVTPMVATVKATGLVMDDARLEYEMKLDPFSYRPTFQMAARMLGLNVTKLNSLARAYGDFDYEGGWLDLVVELNVTEGRVEGYVKPLFRKLRVFALRDLTEGNPLLAFWEALVGLVTTALKNQPHDQLGTLIPVRGDLSAPRSDVLATLGNLLRNAFIRAYMPRLQGTASQIDGLDFGPARILENHEPVKPRKPT
jgi:Domain of Unknown Function (DUF748)